MFDAFSYYTKLCWYNRRVPILMYVATYVHVCNIFTPQIITLTYNCVIQPTSMESVT